jgi:splicing factor U2AF subunit
MGGDRDSVSPAYHRHGYRDRDRHNSSDARHYRSKRYRDYGHSDSRMKSRSRSPDGYRNRGDYRYDGEYRNSRTNVSDEKRYRPLDFDQDKEEKDILPLDEWPRKLKNWDVPPTGMEGLSVSQVKATGQFIPASIQPKVTNLTPFVDPNRVITTVAGEAHDDVTAIRAAINPLASKQNRRIYLGGLPSDVSTQEISQFIDNAMRAYGLVKDSSLPSCVQEVILKTDHGYAFIDFTYPEEATGAMSLDGMDFKGASIKIRRPKDYQPMDHDKNPNMANSLSTTSDSPEKIYIGTIPYHITEKQLAELLTTFGELKSLHLVKDSLGASKGFAFCEYKDPAVTDIACQGLNGLELGDRKLILQRASIGAKQASINRDYEGSATISGISNAPAISLPHMAILTGQSDSTTQPQPLSTVLQLMNMVTIDELEDDEEYQDIVEDVKSECSRYGNIIDLYIPRPSSDQSVTVKGLGRIFIEYETTDQAATAAKALTGRKFSDRIVMTAYYPEDLFHSRKFE